MANYFKTSLIKKYIKSWSIKGYQDDIPDEVPAELMRLNLAPSYKAIVIAILKNDVNFSSLGFNNPASKYYFAIKRDQLEKEGRIPQKKHIQLLLFV